MKILLIVICAAAALLILLFAACAVILNGLISLKTIPIPKFIYTLISGNAGSSQKEKDLLAATEHFKSLPLEEIEMDSAGCALRAKLLLPQNSNGILLIACHGARNSAIGEFAVEADYFYNNGFTVLMPEHRGCGISGGAFMGYGTHESADTLMWLEYAKKRFPNLNIFLLGVSMGAATVLMMSDRVKKDEVRGIISDCAYTSAWAEFEYQLKSSFHLPAFPVLHICNLLCRLFARYSFKDAAPIEHVKHSAVPVLFIHGKNDYFVPFYMEKELYDACRSEKELLSVEGAAHAESYYRSSALYEQTLNAFFEKHIASAKQM